MLSIGLMSGTSMDGIDAALLRTDGESSIVELGHASLQYDLNFKILLHAAQYCIKKYKGDMIQAEKYYEQVDLKNYLQDELHLDDITVKEKITDLHHYMKTSSSTLPSLTLNAVIQHSTYLHAKIVKMLLEKTNYQATDIDVVGYHGQAMYHQPNQGISIIVGDGQALADQLNIPVVNDFRRCDVASGGQGAPFAPIYHRALAIRDHKIPAAVVNCGGIANVTIIDTDVLMGYDTGPGNGLIDRLVKQRTQGKENIDRDGQFGKKGKVNAEVLQALYQKSIIKNNEIYYAIKPPKALDFGDLHLIDELESLSLEDACATLEAFTADSIVKSLDLLSIAKLPKTWILAGGGWNNPVIRNELEARLKKRVGFDAHVITADEAGWNSTAMEAQIFAHFAVRSLQGKPLSLPETTRVPKPLSGGHAYLPRGDGCVSEKVSKLLENNPDVLSGYCV